MPFDWPAYRKTHPKVAPRVERLVRQRIARERAPVPSRVITEVQKEAAIEAGKTVLEKKSGEVIITEPETGAVQKFIAAIPWKREIVAAVAARPGLPLRSEIRERYRPPTFEPVPSPKFLKPPIMRPDIHVTAPTPFTMYEAEPKAVIGLEKVYEKPPPAGIAEAIYEFAAPLIPKRTEREIAYGPPSTVGIRPILEFPLGVAYGIVTLPAAVIKMPETAYAFVTDPLKSITAMGERFARMPGFFVGEIAGQAAATYGISKLAGLGVARIRARGITTELIVGEYAYRDIAGRRIGLARAKAVILKKKKPIARLDIETIFKPAKLGEISPAVSRIMVTEPKPMRLFAAVRGITYPEIAPGVYPGISKAILFAKRKPISAAAVAGITKVEPGILKAAGISIAAPPRARAVFGAIFREANPPPPVTLIRAAPKVITKSGVPAVVVTTKAITKAVGKVITKPGPTISRIGVISGAITPIVTPRYRPVVEEEVYIAPRAREVVGVPALDVRQRAITLQRFGLGVGQAQRTMQQLGIGRVTVPRERLDLRQPPALIQVPIQRLPPVLKPPIQKVIPKLKRPPALKRVPISGVPIIPVSLPGVPIALIPVRKKKVPRKRKPRVRPRYKYREIKHPFPSIKKLMGI